MRRVLMEVNLKASSKLLALVSHYYKEISRVRAGCSTMEPGPQTFISDTNLGLLTYKRVPDDSRCPGLIVKKTNCLQAILSNCSFFIISLTWPSPLLDYLSPNTSFLITGPALHLLHKQFLDESSRYL